MAQHGVLVVATAALGLSTWGAQRPRQDRGSNAAPNRLGLFTKKSLIGAAKWRFRFTWATAKALPRKRLLLQQPDATDQEALARLDARIAQIDNQLDRYLDLMAWYYHSYDEIKGVTLRRMKEFGFTVELLEKGGRKGETKTVAESDDNEHDDRLQGYVVGYEGREGRYRLDQQWTRNDAEAESATGDPLNGLIDPASR